MNKYNIQSFLDLLEIKGVLKERQEAEVRVLCHLNATNPFSFKLGCAYLFFIGLYLGALCLLAIGDHIGLIDLGLASNQWHLAIVFSLIGACLQTFCRPLTAQLYYLVELTTHLFVLTSTVFMIWALHLSFEWAALIFMSAFIAINYVFFKEVVIRVLMITLMALYSFVYLVPQTLSVAAFMLLVLSALTILFVASDNQSIRPIGYGLIAPIMFEGIGLTFNGELPFHLQNFSIATFLFQLGLLSLIIGQAYALKICALKPISNATTFCLIGLGTVAALLHPTFTIGILLLMIGYRHVNYFILLCGLSFLVLFGGLFFYSLPLTLEAKAILMALTGLVFYALHTVSALKSH